MTARSGSAVDWPRGRRGADAVLAALGLVALAMAGFSAHRARPTVVETNLFRLINQLPSPFNAPLLGIMQLGALGAVAGLGFLALVAGRYQVASVVAAAGTLAWAASKLVQWLVDEEPARLRITDVRLHAAFSANPGLAFPASHVAVTAAITVAAAPYIGRSVQRLCWLTVATVAVARIYVGLHLPVDVFGGLALGLAVGAVVNLVLGVPGRGPSRTQLRHVLAAVGVQVEAVAQAGQSEHLVCRTADGSSYLVKILSWDGPDQGWLSRLWRLVAYRQLYDPTGPSAPAQRADREAHITLLAERAGVRTPSLLVARDLNHQTSIVVRRWVEGVLLAELPAERLTDALLQDAWGQLAAVHEAGILHRHRDPGRILVDGDGRVWMMGWGAARIGVDPADRAVDRAELAVVLASRVGAERAVRAAGDMETDWFRHTLVHLQPVALGPAARRVVRADPELLSSVRGELAALEGRNAPAPITPTRLIARNLAPVVALAVAVYVLLPRLARSTATFATVRHAHWPWLALAAGGALLTYVMSAVALMAAAGRVLPFRRTVAVQLAAASTNRVVPAGLGAVATNIRYLEIAGLERPEAASAVGLAAAGGFVTHTAATVVAVVALRGRVAALHAPDIDTTWPALLALGGGCAALGWLIWAHRLHEPVRRWVGLAVRNIGLVLTDPARLAMLLAASAGISVGYIVALAATLAAFGVRSGLGTVAGVYLGAAAVGNLTPTPGGVGPFEAAAVTALGGVGVVAGPAVATVLTFRLITYWLPVAPGAIALHILRRRHLL